MAKRPINSEPYDPFAAAYEEARPINRLRLLTKAVETVDRQYYEKPYQAESNPPPMEDVLALARRLKAASERFLASLEEQPIGGVKEG